MGALPRFLAFFDLFYAPHGFCHNCQHPLQSKRNRTLCSNCQSAPFQYRWDYVAPDVVAAAGKCLRCGRTDRLETCHMLSVHDIQVRRKYPVLTLPQWKRGEARKEGKKLHEWAWTPDLEKKWRKQILFNRRYMEAVLDRRNLRVFCRGCHDYADMRAKLQRLLRKYRAGVWHQIFSFRLKVLDDLNTPEQVRRNGYTPYWKEARTHYSRWVKLLKLERASRRTPRFEAYGRKVDLSPSIPPSLK